MMRTGLFSATCLAALVLSFAPAGARNVGITSAVNKAATGLAPTGGVRTLTLGDNIIFNEKIRTDGAGLLQILLADGTSFTVGPNSDLTIDRFVYDPDSGKAEVAATMTKGVFRFIGAKTSKFAGGVKIDSPVGTIGIRGAVADISLPDQGDLKAQIDMVFGKELTLTGRDGVTRRVYEPGYSIFVHGGGRGGNERRSTIEKTPKGSGTIIQSALSGKPGTTGGSPNSPKDETIEVSGIGQQNSNLSPTINNPPIPMGRPDGTGTDSEGMREASRDVTQRNVQEVIDAETPTTPPLKVPVRVLTAGSTYDGLGEPIDNAGSKGLIGGSERNDQIVTLSSSSGNKGSGDAVQGTLTLPLYEDGPFTQHQILASEGYTFAGVPLSGRVYSGEEGFTAYLLSLEGDATDPLIAIKGTPLKDISVLLNGDVRTYSMTPDLLQDAFMPFTRADALPVDDIDATVTDFHIIEPANQSGSIRFLQSSLLISGSGVDQVSQIGVNVGQIFDDSVYRAEFGRRGSVKDSSTAIARTFYGGIATQGGAEGGNQIFGSNGQNIVLGNNSVENDYFNDRNGGNGADEKFATLHVLNLEREESIAGYLLENGSTRLLGQVSSIRGFASGVEQGVREDGTGYLFNSVSSSPDDVYIEFDASENTLGGELKINSDTTSLSMAFGKGVKGNAESGAATYIDDDTFAAVNNNSHTRTNLHDLDEAGNITATYVPISGRNTNSYFVSGDTVPQESVLAEGKLCECKFLEWGWWGAQINAAEDPGATAAEVRSTVHLGSWVAGDITSEVELSTLAGTTGTFEGKAVGTVIASTGSNLATYVASGDMNMSFDFGSRSGSMALTNFDNRNFSGSIESGSGTDAVFSGTLAQDNEDASGALKGAFVNDGRNIAQGVIGDFSLSNGSTWWGVGVIGGARTPAAP